MTAPRGNVPSRKDVSVAAARARAQCQDAPIPHVDGWGVRAERLRVFVPNVRSARQFARWYYRLVHLASGKVLGGSESLDTLADQARAFLRDPARAEAAAVHA